MASERPASGTSGTEREPVGGSERAAVPAWSRRSVIALAAGTIPGCMSDSGVGGSGRGAAGTGGGGADPPGDGTVARAIADSRSYLLSRQGTRGDHWASNVVLEERFDLANALYYALLLDYLDREAESKRRAIEWALERREEGGGWGDRNANYLGLLALRRVDAAGHAGAIEDVRSENRSEGYDLADAGSDGFINSPIRVKLFYLALSDRYDREELFDGRTVRRLLRLMRMTPAFDDGADGVDTDEPFVIPGAIDQLLATALLLLDGATGGDEPELERMRTVSRRLLLGRRQADGVWGTAHATILATFALARTGYDADHPQVERALGYLRTRRQRPNGRIVGFELPVWDTAYALKALDESGVDRDRDVMRRAVEWLYGSRTAPVSEKEADPVLDRQPLPFTEHSGDGWGYKPYVPSDWDTTSVALETMGRYRGTSVYGDREAADDVEFLLDVQNSDGSWSSWATDYSPLNSVEKWLVILGSDRQLYRVLFTNHPSPDVTGHALEALGTHGHTVANSGAVRDAVDWLLGHRDADGLWVGTWGRGYAYGTSRALLGMEAVGVDTSRGAVQHAGEALVERQHRDGSWGPDGGGPTYTAWALQAVLAAGLPADRPAVRRGVRYLLDGQREDGSWPRELVMHNWGTMHYSLGVFTQAAALRALVRYADAAGIEYRPTGPHDAVDRHRLHS